MDEVDVAAEKKSKNDSKDQDSFSGSDDDDEEEFTASRVLDAESILHVNFLYWIISYFVLTVIYIEFNNFNIQRYI